MCEKCYRKSYKYMRNNSTRQKGKKIQLYKIKGSSTTVRRYMTNKGWKALKRKKRRTCGHGVKRICKLCSKGRRAGKLTWCEPLETIWTIVDKTTYKDPAPKTLDELREWLRFVWKNVSLDTLWELVHSIPHHLENVRKHKGRHFGY